MSIHPAFAAGAEAFITRFLTGLTPVDHSLVNAGDPGLALGNVMRRARGEHDGASHKENRRKNETEGREGNAFHIKGRNERASVANTLRKLPDTAPVYAPPSIGLKSDKNFKILKNFALAPCDGKR